MGTLITAATIMALYLNLAGNMNSRYFYNADIENGKVTTMYVYDRQGESLSGKMEYRYAYDGQGRVTVRVVYAVSAGNGMMEPVSHYDYRYTADGYSLTHSRWDRLRGCFAPADSRTDYRAEGTGLVSVSAYGLRGCGSDATPADRFMAIVPADGGMAAEF